jgi:hypothetical protein
MSLLGSMEWKGSPSGEGHLIYYALGDGSTWAVAEFGGRVELIFGLWINKLNHTVLIPSSRLVTKLGFAYSDNNVDKHCVARAGLVD